MDINKLSRLTQSTNLNNAEAETPASTPETSGQLQTDKLTRTTNLVDAKAETPVSPDEPEGFGFPAPDQVARFASDFQDSIGIEATTAEPAFETLNAPVPERFTSGEMIDRFDPVLSDAIGAAERAFGGNVGKTYPNTTEGTVQFLLDAAVRQTPDGRIAPDRNAMLDRLSQLSPDEFKAVMQSLMDKGQFEKIIGTVGSNRLGSILANLMPSAQNDPALLDTIVKTIDAAGADKVFPGLGTADPQLLKLLPERQLVKMLIASESSSLWPRFYEALKSKGPSAAGQKVLIDETVEHLTHEANAVVPFDSLDQARMVGITTMLSALNPQDYKEVIGKLTDAGKFLPLLENMATTSADGRAEAGKVLGNLLQRAQSDPDLVSLLQQCLNDKTISDNCSVQFVANSTPQSLSVLSEDTLMKLMDACEGKPQWDTVFEALNIKNPS